MLSFLPVMNSSTTAALSFLLATIPAIYNQKLLRLCYSILDYSLQFKFS